MHFSSTRALAVALAVPLLFGCSPGKNTEKATGGRSPQMAGMAMAPITIPDGVIYTAADVHFMQGMIAHHAQAIYMTNMAARHGANPRVLKFAQKIEQSQTAEIRIMQRWLSRNNQFVPDTSSWRQMHMPGMLSAQQLTMLDAAHGDEFDREFLTFMMQHHEGALKMVSDLFATPLAGQDVDVSVFANDVQLVQTAEIGIMEKLLANEAGNSVPATPLTRSLR